MTDLTDRAPTVAPSSPGHEAARGLRQLADFVEDNPEFARAINQHFLMYVTERDEFVRLARQLGTSRKDPDNDWYRLIRRFGPIGLQLYSDRAKVCERVVTGHETVVETAVRCVHCGGPVAVKGDLWWHVGPDHGDYRYCGTEIDPDGNEVGGLPATPPSFEATETTREIVEWRCAPILADDTSSQPQGGGDWVTDDEGRLDDGHGDPLEAF
jgi:hypothetical protein